MQVHSAKNVLEEYGCEWQEDNKYIDQKTSAVKNTAEQREEFQRLIRDARKRNLILLSHIRVIVLLVIQKNIMNSEEK